MHKNILIKYFVFIIILSCILANIIPTVLTRVNIIKNDSCDIPTWYIGDEWIYTADPVSFQSDNGSFNGKILNLKRKVVGITTINHGDDQFEVYEVNISGDITGVLTWEVISGNLEGIVQGISYIRVSDLAEVKTDIVSTGIIHYLVFNLNYVLTNINSFFPPLELYDFPLKLYDEWNINTNVLTSGSFIIEGFVEEEISGNDTILEMAQCNNKEILSFPSGDFECYKIALSSDKYWYSPEVGNLVKSEVEQIYRDNTLKMDLSLENFSRVIQPINVTENIDPSEAFIYQEIEINGQAFDSNDVPIQNGNIYIEIPRVDKNWVTITDENGYYNITIEAPYIIDDTASEGEFGSDGIIVRCTSGNLEGLKVKSLLIIDDFPPNPPNIEGKIKGRTGVEYEYTFSSQDQDGDNIIFLVNWDDGSPIETVIPSNPSDKESKANHKWDNKGTYNITAKTKDVIGAESKWSEPLSVTVSKNRAINNPIIKFFENHPVLIKILQFLLKNYK